MAQRVRVRKLSCSFAIFAAFAGVHLRPVLLRRHEVLVAQGPMIAAARLPCRARAALPYGKSNTNTSASLPFDSVSFVSSVSLSASPASKAVPFASMRPRAT